MARYWQKINFIKYKTFCESALSLKMCNKLSILGISFASDISSVAKCAPRKLGFLFWFRRLLTPQ